MNRPVLNGIAPFFIVRNTADAIAFYRDKLDFDVLYREPEVEPFFAIVSRDSAMLIVKQVEAEPLPNPTRDP
jgi:catechol 2,3-dioxygenase-like lactoylglutathione lyase family enzyme